MNLAKQSSYLRKHLEKERTIIVVLALLAILWGGLYSNLQHIADWLTYSLLQLDADTQLGESLNFFIYDVPKILLLLSGMIFLISLLQTFIDPNRIRALVSDRREGVGNVMASVFGALTPFCSCSSVPMFIGFVKAGVPLGITFSFLITSPLMNEVAFVLLLGLFGWQVALLYLFSGLLIGVLAGIILGRMRLEGYVESFVFEKQKGSRATVAGQASVSWQDRVDDAVTTTREILTKVWFFVVVGIGIGAFIHGFVPDDMLSSIMGENAWWSVPVSVVLGIPLYSNAAGIIPIVSALLDKGVGLGTALAFMMSVVTLSLPEMIILRRVLKIQLLVIYVMVVAVGIIFTGLLFNLII